MKDSNKHPDKDRIFIRFGKLGLVKQKGYGKSDSLHAPPAPVGFYAMSFRFQETDDNNINSVSKKAGFFSYDHLAEVFFDTKID